MIKKEVKAYGKTQRQRIDFNKGDHLEVGQEVNILTNQEYEELLECQSELQKVKNELTDLIEEARRANRVSSREFMTEQEDEEEEDGEE